VAYSNMTEEYWQNSDRDQTSSELAQDTGQLLQHAFCWKETRLFA